MMLRVNRFLEWIGLKRKLHQGTQSPPLVSAGDIWWASVGENVGSEINGEPPVFPSGHHLQEARPRLLLRYTNNDEVESRLVVRALPTGRPQDGRIAAPGTRD